MKHAIDSKEVNSHIIYSYIK